jgi:hypothetical protein
MVFFTLRKDVLQKEIAGIEICFQSPKINRDDYSCALLKNMDPLKSKKAKLANTEN